MRFNKNKLIFAGFILTLLLSCSRAERPEETENQANAVSDAKQTAEANGMVDRGAVEKSFPEAKSEAAPGANVNDNTGKKSYREYLEEHRRTKSGTSLNDAAGLPGKVPVVSREDIATLPSNNNNLLPSQEELEKSKQSLNVIPGGESNGKKIVF